MEHQYRTEKLQLKHGVHPNQLDQQGQSQRGQPQQGRPRNSKDTQKRKRRTFKVRTKAALLEAFSWAEDAMRTIAEVTGPAYLKKCGKANFRQLSSAEAEDYERFKFALLVNLPAGKKVGPRIMAEVLGKPMPIPVAVDELLTTTMGRYREEQGREPSTEKVREFMTRIVALHNIRV
jgi:hypothetical protein